MRLIFLLLIIVYAILQLSSLVMSKKLLHLDYLLKEIRNFDEKSAYGLTSYNRRKLNVGIFIASFLSVYSLILISFNLFKFTETSVIRFTSDSIETDPLVFLIISLPICMMILFKSLYTKLYLDIKFELRDKYSLLWYLVAILLYCSVVLSYYLFGY